MFDDEIGSPLDARVVERIENSAFVREAIVFTTRSGGRISGWLAVPKGIAVLPPCVLLLHGFGMDKDAWWHPDNPAGPLAPRLLQSGYAVFALDAALSGNRSRIANADPSLFRGKPGRLHRFRESIVQTVTHYRRGLDYMATRPDIDPRRRAVIGYSMGGVMALQLLAMEPRLTAGISCVAPPMSMPLESGASAVTFRAKHATPSGPAEYNRALGAKRILFLMATDDKYYTPAAAEALVNLIPGQNKDLRFFASGHMLPHDYIDDAIEWLDTNLDTPPLPTSR